LRITTGWRVSKFQGSDDIETKIPRSNSNRHHAESNVIDKETIIFTLTLTAIVIILLSREKNTISLPYFVARRDWRESKRSLSVSSIQRKNHHDDKHNSNQLTSLKLQVQITKFPKLFQQS
jgi:hypothetical protein